MDWVECTDRAKAVFCLSFFREYSPVFCLGVVVYTLDLILVLMFSVFFVVDFVAGMKLLILCVFFFPMCGVEVGNPGLFFYSVCCLP